MKPRRLAFSLYPSRPLDSVVLARLDVVPKKLQPHWLRDLFLVGFLAETPQDSARCHQPARRRVTTRQTHGPVSRESSRSQNGQGSNGGAQSQERAASPDNDLRRLAAVMG